MQRANQNRLGICQIVKQLLPLIVCCIVLSAALTIMPDRLIWANYGGDSGDLLAAILTRGIPHPTGYPTYLLLGDIFQRFPAGTPYWRGALLSAIPIAMTAGLLAIWIKRAIDHYKPTPQAAWWGALGGLIWGLSPLVLSQAVIVDVYGLNTLFVMIGLYWLAILIEPDINNRRKWLPLSCAGIFGLGLGNHLTLILLMPVIGCALWRAMRRGLSGRWVAAQGGLCLVGLSVYVILPLRAQAYPAVNWGNPQTWSGLFWLITAQPYHHFLAELSVGGAPERAGAWFDVIRQQYGLAGLALGVVGALLSFEQKHTYRWLLVWIFGIYSVFTLVYHTADAVVYLIPASMALAIWISLLLVRLWQGLPHRLGQILALMGAVCLLVLIPGNVQRVDARTDTQVDDFARHYLNVVPQNAILFTQSDLDTFALWFYHDGLDWRPDVNVISQQLAQFPWYIETLHHVYPSLVLPEWEGDRFRWSETLGRSNPAHPVCYSWAASEIPIRMEYVCRDL